MASDRPDGPRVLCVKMRHHSPWQVWQSVQGHTYRHVCIYIYIYVYTHTYIHAYMHIYIYIYTYIHTYTHSYTYIYIYTLYTITIIIYIYIYICILGSWPCSSEDQLGRSRLRLRTVCALRTRLAANWKRICTGPVDTWRRTERSESQEAPNKRLKGEHRTQNWNNTRRRAHYWSPRYTEIKAWNQSPSCAMSLQSRWSDMVYCCLLLFGVNCCATPTLRNGVQKRYRRNMPSGRAVGSAVRARLLYVIRLLAWLCLLVSS